MVGLAVVKEGGKALLHWDSPLHSAGVLATVLSLLISICYFSFISVVAYLSLTLLVVVIAIKIYSWAMVFMKKAEPGSDPLVSFTQTEMRITPDKVAEVTGIIVDILNPAIMELRRLFLLENWLDTIKFVLCLWGFTYIGSWFNMMTLVILSWVSLFTLPLLYKNNQAAVDEVVGQVNTQITEIKDKVMSVIPSKNASKKEE